MFALLSNFDLYLINEELPALRKVIEIGSYVGCTIEDNLGRHGLREGQLGQLQAPEFASLADLIAYQ